jgi:hypothetical protein
MVTQESKIAPEANSTSRGDGDGYGKGKDLRVIQFR